MVSSHLLSALLLAGPAAARPRWWSYHGPGPNAKAAQAAPQAASTHTLPPGAFVSNGVLYMLTTITLQPGQNAPPTAPVAPQVPSAPAFQASSVAPVAPVVAPAPTTLSTATQPASSQSSVAVPVEPVQSPESNIAAGSVSVDQILAVSPKSQSCDGAQKPAECATAAQAAPALSNAFSKYGINTPGAQAAVIALEAFESVNFEFKTHQGGNVGQGTRAMFMPPFVQKYATALYPDKVQSAGGDLAKILELVNSNDNDSFGSGAWFLSTQCPDLISQLNSSPDDAWNTYITSCVGTAMTADRQAYWTLAKTAFKVA